MLREIRIKNFAVIETVTVPFAPGLNVLTGETGAGKSIVIDAILLVSGGRGQTDVIRSDAETATVEAVFDLPRGGGARRVLEEAGIPADESALVIRRELARSGRHRAFVNDSPVTVGLLERLGEQLAEIHGQHEHQRLLQPLAPLDAAAAQIEEALLAVRKLREGIDAEPGRLEAIDERLDAIARLKRKYGDTEAAMLEFRDAAAAELDRGQRHDEIVAAKERRAAELLTQLRAAASAVSETRREAAGRLGPRAQRELRELGVERARFDIVVEAAPAEQIQARGLDG